MGCKHNPAARLISRTKRGALVLTKTPLFVLLSEPVFREQELEEDGKERSPIGLAELTRGACLTRRNASPYAPFA